MSRLREEYARQSGRDAEKRKRLEEGSDARAGLIKRTVHDKVLAPAFECHIGPGKALRGSFWFCGTHRLWFRMKPYPGARPAGCPVSDFALKVWEALGPL